MSRFTLANDLKVLGFELLFLMSLLSLFVISSCADNDSGQVTGSTLPGALFRKAAGMPDTIGEEMVVLAEYQNDIEDAIYKCMRLKGFDYFPQRVDGEHRTDSFGLDLSPDEYAEEFGFGIAKGFIAGLATVQYSEEDYLQSLNRKEREAYMIALNGEQALDPPGTEIIEIGGCQGEARTSVEEPEWFKHANWLEAAFNKYYDRLVADPRIIAIDQEWTSCMQHAGFDVWSSVDDLGDSLIEEFGELSANFRPIKPFNSGEEFLEALDEESAAAYATFQAKEIELAIAARKCSMVNEETVNSIMNELQTRILSTDAPD